jgi:carbonic anhydrase/acetyltransferase-like protein (isoleucine patch superfamily)
MKFERYGYDFIPANFLTPGKDEYWRRDEQLKTLDGARLKNARAITPAEIETLERNGNTCSNWNNFLVSDPFDPALIRNSAFYGLIRLGTLRSVLLKHNDFCIPAGIRNSTIISCDIGDDTAIQDCAYISHYIIGGGCILSCVNEMQTTNHAKFGNGIIKDGEEESVRVWIDVMNEMGGRSVLPFDAMIPADAFLWAAYRDDTVLTEKLKQITQEQYGAIRGSYGTIGDGAVIKSCAIIKDTAVGRSAYIKGANKLKNITILSSPEEPTQIGESVELVNGIVGYGCNVFYGSKAVRFVLGRNCKLKYGARLIHSVLGDNSTVSCCEILNNLIFPVHEQHHNNSFLIASLLQGVSNMAAATTIGSNHNSRANDGEIRAGRGFWPGLAVTLKHSSVFASFTIIAKGDYPAELKIPLPFSLISNNVHKNRLEVLPAYFWMHNLYALERNSWKARDRDHRTIKVQHIETDYLAPDTAEEIIAALLLLEGWLGEAGFSPGDMTGVNDASDMRIIPCRHMEKSKRHQVIIKPLEAVAAYRLMLHWYAAKTIAAFFDSRPELDYGGLRKLLTANNSPRISEWVNIGGQISPAFRVDELRREIGADTYRNWDEIHRVYGHWYDEYPLDKARHAWAVMAFLGAPFSEDIGADGTAFLKQKLSESVETRRWISDQIYQTRLKDYRDPFRKATFRNTAEMEQVMGKPDENHFIRLAHKEDRFYEELITRVTSRL